MKWARFFFILNFLSLLTGIVFAKTLSTRITVYNQGIALVQKVETIFVKKGIQRISIKNVPSSIEPSSVFVQELSHPGQIQILTQIFNDNLVSRDRLLTEYLGRKIEVEITHAKSGKSSLETAKLLSINPNIILEINHKVYLTPPGKLLFPVSRKKRFLIRPKLSWLVKSARTGKEKILLSYLTKGMSWKGNYVAVINHHHLDLAGWAEISNRSGADFHHAALNLMSGEIHLVSHQVIRPPMYSMMAKPLYTGNPTLLQQSKFFEYHLYHLKHQTSLLNNRTSQIQFVSAFRIPYTKIYTYENSSIISYYVSSQNHRVTVLLKFNNSRKDGIGVPLPAGKILLYKDFHPSGRGELLIGEDAVSDTPVGKKVKVKVGNAFELSAAEKQLSYKIVVPEPGGVYEKKIEVILKNRKKIPVRIRVVQDLPPNISWKIVQSSDSYHKISSSSFDFSPEVQAGGKAKIIYTIRYHS
jgi:hypothetical protein